MDYGSGVYNFVLLLHILASVVGFGSVFFAGVYGDQARRRKGVEGLAIAETVRHIGHDWAAKLIYAVPVFGIVLLLFDDNPYGFDQLWISLSFLVYLAALGVLHGVLRANERRMIELMRVVATTASTPSGVSGGVAGDSGRGVPSPVAELDHRARRAAMFNAVFDLLVVVALVLMVWKPGAT